MHDAPFRCVAAQTVAGVRAGARAGTRARQALKRVVAAAALALGTFGALARAGGAAPRAGGDPEAPPCIAAWTEARPRFPGYDHLAHIANQCRAAIACTVTTDASPDVAAERVAPGEEVEILTLRGSPASQFRAQIVCREQAR